MSSRVTKKPPFDLTREENGTPTSPVHALTDSTAFVAKSAVTHSHRRIPKSVAVFEDPGTPRRGVGLYIHDDVRAMNAFSEHPLAGCEAILEIRAVSATAVS
jgi:hypothetical protein